MRDPKNALWSDRAPEVYRVRVDTSKGSVVLEVTRALAPRGADKLSAGLKPASMTTRGFPRESPERLRSSASRASTIAKRLENQQFPDDPVRASNVRNLSLCHDRTGCPHHCVSINTSDQLRQDAQGFAPACGVIEEWALSASFIAGTASGRAAGCGRPGRHGYSGRQCLSRS